MAALEKDLKNCVSIISSRLYYVALSNQPSQSTIHHLNQKYHFFSIDSELVYWNFFLDFGPLNFGQLYRFCEKLNEKLADPKIADKVIYYYSSAANSKRTNAAFLICSWSMLYQNKSPDEAYAPFKNISPPFPTWHDATPAPCTFQLTILDTLKGLYKARQHKFFNLETFNIAEYEHFEQVENGDLNWCVDNKFIAFAGPHATRSLSAGGYHTLCPADYLPYFKKKNVQLVVRLNKKYYSAETFTREGIGHVDLEFLDGSNPPDHILAEFLKRCEAISGAAAVHCKAGLGRTGCCIGAYIMKHYRLTAEETIGWLRISRPGMIIGPQQYYMREIQFRMWQDGESSQSLLLQKRPATASATASFNRSVSSPATSLVADMKNSTISNVRRTTGNGKSALSKPSTADLPSTYPGTTTNDKRRFDYKEDAVAPYDNDDDKDNEGHSQGDLLRMRREQQMKAAGHGIADPTAEAVIDIKKTPTVAAMSSFRAMTPTGGRRAMTASSGIRGLGVGPSLALKHPVSTTSQGASGSKPAANSTGSRSPLSPSSTAFSFFSSWRSVNGNI